MSIFMSAILATVIVVLLLWLISVTLLKGQNLSAFDRPGEEGAQLSFPRPGGPSEGHRTAVVTTREFNASLRGQPRKKRLQMIRDHMDSLGRDIVVSGHVSAADAGGVPAEWVCAEGSRPDRRILYIHGGAYIAGSPLSHRNITHRFSEITGASVLSIDYRLMPENRRKDGILDCRKAYRWILQNGPDGPGATSYLVIAGDSAGGNLTLSLSAWVRDEKMRLPDAVVALSPSVDGTFSSPSIRRNVKTDIMLGPLFSILLKVPAWQRRWLYLLESRFRPNNPVVSPIFGDLSGLSPTLIQVSEAEMLLDDARRYVNKARASGTHAVAQSWADMLHVWHFFYPDVEEAEEAWREIRSFLQTLPR
ncbi:MAG TPA: alpha/beta hydrolase [Xanthomonadales bacterium]|nr:alpha/beta hydrolase [Xanthomonadales bacterium]